MSQHQKISTDLEAILGNLQSPTRVEVCILIAEPSDAGADAQHSAGDPRRLQQNLAAVSSPLIKIIESDPEFRTAVDLLDQEPRDALELCWLEGSIRGRLPVDLIRRLATEIGVESIIRADDRIDAAFSFSESDDARQGPVTTNRPRLVAHELMSVKKLWDKGLTGKGVKVALIDTGISQDHPDLSRFQGLGFNLSRPGTPPSDDDGHGTAMAGLIAGLYTGVSPDVELLAFKVDDRPGSARRAMCMALQEGAQILCLPRSWPRLQGGQPVLWRRVSQRLLGLGVLLAASHGNNGQDRDLTFFHPVPNNVPCPADCPPPWLHSNQRPAAGLSSSVACGSFSVSDKNQPELTSSHGPTEWEFPLPPGTPFNDYPHSFTKALNRDGLIKPEICAPGGGSVSCRVDHKKGDLYSKVGGASAATAHVAGCMALLVQAWQDSAGIPARPVDPAKILEAIEEGADKFPGQTGKENVKGSGRLNVFGAWKYGRHKTRKWWK